MEKDKNKLIRVDVSGQNPDTWKKLRSKLVDFLYRCLDTPINAETGATVKDEVKDFSSLALKFAKEKLKRPDYENQESLARINEAFAKAEKERALARKHDAEAKKIAAEADTIEFENMLRKWKFMLELHKGMFIGKEDEESLIVTAEINHFLIAIQEMQKKLELPSPD